jgi:hypothetical protein
MLMSLLSLLRFLAVVSFSTVGNCAPVVQATDEIFIFINSRMFSPVCVSMKTGLPLPVTVPWT